MFNKIILIPLFVYTSVGAIIIFSLAAILLKYAIPEVGGSVQFATVQFGLSLILHLFLLIGQIILYDSSLQVSMGHILLIVLASLFGYSGFLSYIYGLEVGNASVGAVVLSSRVFIAVPLGILLLGEIYPPLVYIGILSAFVGAVLVSWQKGLSFVEILKFRSAGIRFFILTALLWSIQNFIIRQLNNQVPLLLLLTLRVFIFTIFSGIIYYILRKRSIITPARISQSSLPKLSIYVIMSLIAQLGLVYALGENLSITETIGVFEGTLTFIFSLIFVKFVNNNVLQEELDLKIILIKVTGIILSVSGTLLTIFLI